MNKTVQVNNIYPANDLNKKQDTFACNRLNNGNVYKSILLLQHFRLQVLHYNTHSLQQTVNKKAHTLNQSLTTK